MTAGTRVGSFVGSVAAVATQGAKAGVSYTGQFGRDVVAGAQTGYASKTASIIERRAQLMAERDAQRALPAPVAVAQPVARRAKVAA